MKKAHALYQNNRKIIRDDADGTIILFLRTESKFNWQGYIKLRNNPRYVRFSTGKTDFWKATKIAIERFEKIVAQACRGSGEEVLFHMEAIILVSLLPDDLSISTQIQELQTYISGICSLAEKHGRIIKLTEYFQDLLRIIPLLTYTQWRYIFECLREMELLVMKHYLLQKRREQFH